MDVQVPGELTVKVLIHAVLFCLVLCAESHASCTVSTTNVNFGTYDVFAANPADSTGSITVACDEAPPPDMLIAIGPSGYSGVINPRQMKNGAGPDRLDYNLFTTASMSVIWGDGTAGSSTVLVAKVKKNQPPRVLTLYGRIPPGQNVSAGSYGDSLTVTIDW
jgi:spore coat protein U-like protein